MKHVPADTYQTSPFGWNDIGVRTESSRIMPKQYWEHKCWTLKFLWQHLRSDLATTKTSLPWGQPAAYLAVTSRSYCCGDFKVVVISYAWMHPGSQGIMISGIQWRKPQLKSHNSIHNWPIFTKQIHIPITFSLEHCTVVSNSNNITKCQASLYNIYQIVGKYGRNPICPLHG